MLGVIKSRIEQHFSNFRLPPPKGCTHERRARPPSSCSCTSTRPAFLKGCANYGEKKGCFCCSNTCTIRLHFHMLGRGKTETNWDLSSLWSKLVPNWDANISCLTAKKGAKAARSFPTCHMIFKTEARAGEKPVQSGVWPLSFRLKMHVAML